MLKLQRIFKNYEETGSFNEQINLYGFVDSHVFLTKTGDLGVVLEVRGVDYECLDGNTLDGLTKRLESALKLFDDNYRIYQYLFKRNNETIPYKLYGNPVVDTAIKTRIGFFAAKAGTLFSLSIYYVILFEGFRYTRSLGTSLLEIPKRPVKALGELEHNTPIGLVRRFPKDEDAWRQVDRLGILIRINDAPSFSRIRFNSLAEHYLKADFGADAVRPKSKNSTSIMEHIVRDYLIARWGKEIAEDIKPLDIQRWLKSLNTESKLAWTTIAKMRGVMSRIYKVGMLHERVTKNPVLHVETRCKTNYRAIVITPTQTFKILKSLTNNLHYILVLTCAATALRSSEILALRWADILWLEEHIRVSKRWVKGMDGETKTDASDGYVPLHPVLAHHLRQWHSQTPYKKDIDFVFPSFKACGRVPLSSSIFVADYLRPAAKAAGVQIQDGQRFGLHNLRHSLSNWLVNKAKVEPKTVQGILRHSRIQTTLDLYTQEDSDEARGAQGEFLKAVGVHKGMTQ